MWLSDDVLTYCLSLQPTVATSERHGARTPRWLLCARYMPWADPMPATRWRSDFSLEKLNWGMDWPPCLCVDYEIISASEII